MAKTTGITKVDPAKIYTSWQTFTGDGIDTVINRGDRLRGTHPAVKRWPEYFVEDGTPKAEWPGLLDGAIEDGARRAEAERLEELRRNPPIPESEIVVCTEDLMVGFGRISAGTRHRRTDPLVKKYPQFFSEPPRPLVAK